MSMPITDLMVCPRTRASLVQEGDTLVSTHPIERLKYAIKDGIPVMLASEAVLLTEEQWRGIMSRHQRDPTTGEPA